MNRLPLDATEREIVGKKVKAMRKQGFLPAHVFGNKIDTEHVTVSTKEFLKTFAASGETGIIDLKIGAEKVRPVLVRDVQVDPVKGTPLHIDFYQVNLKEKVTVSVPLELIGDQPEKVLSGDAVVIQTMDEVEVEALPMELPESIQINISVLKDIDDQIIVSNLQVPEGVTILAEAEAVVAKLDTAVSAETLKLLEEQATEQAAAVEAAASQTTGGEEVKEGEESAEGATEGKPEETGDEEKQPKENSEEKS